MANPVKLPVLKAYPLGDSAITFEFGQEISTDASICAISLSNSITKHPFPGFIESLPAYSSVTVFFDPFASASLSLKGEYCFEAVTRTVLNFYSDLGIEEETERKPIEIPVNFSSENAPDLDFVAVSNGLKKEEVIEIFTSETYRVFMLGFLPGFPYMAQIDKRIAAPRLETPRQKVPKGSVGIAGLQTGIYPLESPGGWRLIGRTETDLFFDDQNRPTLFAPGDRVRFVRV